MSIRWIYYDYTMRATITAFGLASVSILFLAIGQTACNKPSSEFPVPDTTSLGSDYYDAFRPVTVEQAKGKKYQPRCNMEAQPQVATEEALQKVETQLGQALPAEYREFLREYNGVAFPYPSAVFTLPEQNGDDDVGRIEQFFSVDGMVNIVESQDDYDFKLRVPPEIISISEWNGYFRVCIAIAGPERGAIYWWEPGLPWETDDETVATRQYLTKVANDFAEFWNMLRPGEP